MGKEETSKPGIKLPKFDLAGPTVDDDIRRIISRYGPEAVKEAVINQTKARRGRPPEKDWPDLHDFHVQDAIDWLNGNESLSVRTNYSIAKQVADKNPGHSAVATHERIERKLKKERELRMLIHAEYLGHDAYPHASYLRTVTALKQKDRHEVWQRTFERTVAEIKDYEAKRGLPVSAVLLRCAKGEASTSAARAHSSHRVSPAVSPKADKLIDRADGLAWDIPAVPMRWGERQVLSQTDFQSLPYRHRIGAESGPITV